MSSLVSSRIGAAAAAILLLWGCSSPAATRGAVPSGAQALDAEYPAWVFDAADGWDSFARPLVMFVKGSAPRVASVDAAEDAAFGMALGELGVELATVLIDVGREVSAGNAPLSKVLTSSGFIDDVLTVSLDQSASRHVSEPRITGKWFDLDNVIVRVRYDVERALLSTYNDRFGNALRSLGERSTSDHEARIRQAFVGSVARFNHAR